MIEDGSHAVPLPLSLSLSLSRHPRDPLEILREVVHRLTRRDVAVPPAELRRAALVLLGDDEDGVSLLGHDSPTFLTGSR